MPNPITDPAYWKDKYVFPSMVEGYIKGLGDKWTPKTVTRLKEAGLDVTKLPPAIPGNDMGRYIVIIAQEAWPNEPLPEQMRLLGLWSIRGWQKGLLGAAATQMLRLIGPRRALMRLDRAFSTADNFSRSTTDFPGEREAVITITDPNDSQTYWAGIVEAGLEMLGLTGSVTLDAPTKPHVVTIRVKWN